MRVWTATGALLLAAVAAAFAFVLQSVVLAVLATCSAALGLLLGRAGGGWGEYDSRGQHPFSTDGHDAQRGSR